MSRFKTELCNNLIELGNCKYGDRCHYAHGAHELRQVSKRHPKYRTERCKNFELTGKCPFGPRCSYVHPKPDLDSMIEQLTKYMQHTKAPKPDLEDDERAIKAIIRTPLGAHNTINTNNILSPLTNFSNNYQVDTLHSKQGFTPVNQHSIISSNTFSNNLKNVSGNINFGTCSENEPIFGTSTNFESNKKLSSISHNSTSSTSSTASNPFGINNPLSDLINQTNLNSRSPLQSNKQFYTRF